MDDLLQATKEHFVEWDPVCTFQQSRQQSNESFEEQRLAIEIACSSIDKYHDVLMSPSITKNVRIRGFPGGGKPWCSMYCVIYAISCGLDCLTTAMMARRTTTLGGTHWHKFFGLPIDSKFPQRMAELAIQE